MNSVLALFDTGEGIMGKIGRICAVSGLAIGLTASLAPASEAVERAGTSQSKPACVSGPRGGGQQWQNCTDVGENVHFVAHESVSGKVTSGLVCVEPHSQRWLIGWGFFVIDTRLMGSC